MPGVGQQIIFPGGGSQSESLNIGSDGELTVYVEWVSASHGTANLSLVDKNVGFVFDTLTFHTFNSVAIGLSGEQFSESSGSGNALDSGIFDVMVQMYESGYDAYYFNEDDVYSGPYVSNSYTGQGPVKRVIDNAVGGPTNLNLPPGQLAPYAGRFVTEVGLIGHSHGGGSVYDLTWRLNLWGYQYNPFTISFTGYVDAIVQRGINAETRLPVGTAFHANYYQRNGVIDGYEVAGAQISDDVNADRGWTDENGDELTHGTIDNSQDLQDELLDLFRQNLSR